MTINKDLLVGIVGPCGAGKTTLQNGLKNLGYNAQAISQEHSYVPDMWLKLTNPEILIFLQVSQAIGAQRKNFSWTVSEWQEQQKRLTHARQYTHFYLDTSELNIDEVLQSVIQFLDS